MGGVELVASSIYNVLTDKSQNFRHLVAMEKDSISCETQQAQCIASLH